MDTWSLAAVLRVRGADWRERTSSMRLGVLGLLLVAVACSGSNIDVKVDGNVLTSRGFPRAQIRVDEAFEYLGADRFDLHGAADAELHLFGDVRAGRLTRLLWIQFEGYKPSRIFSRYDYSDAPRRTEIGGQLYFDDVWPWRLEAGRARSGSDTQHVLDVLARKNLSIGPETMAIRLVRLDEASRNELMIIYVEDLRDVGLTAAALAEGGAAHDRWPQMSEQLRQRATACFSATDIEAPS